MSDLDNAIRLAVEAHAGQVDKSGAPYILHPLRVMLAMDDERHMIAAVLHDVVEDGDFGHDYILALFGTGVHEAVFALTRQDGETYDAFISRASANDIARRVKIADIQDNLRPGAPHLEARYRKALAALKEADE